MTFFDEAVALFNNIVQIFGLNGFDLPRGAKQIQKVVHHVEASLPGAIFVDRNAIRHTIGLYRLHEETGCSSQIGPLRQHEIKGFPELADRAVESLTLM